MKKILLTTIVLVFIAFLKANAQQEPQLTHYMFNKMVYNPGATGFDVGFCSITGMIHNQWTDFKDPDGASAPVTQTGTIDYTLPLALPAGTGVAIGATFLNDKEAFFTSTGFMFSGAYHTHTLGKLDLNGDIAIGFNAGMLNKAVVPNWRPGTPGDPLLPGTVSNSGFDAGIGIMYRAQDWYAGISALHLPATQLDWTSKGAGTTYTVDRTYFLTGGYNLNFSNPDYQLQPSILLKKDIAKTSLGAAALFYYKQRFYGGLSVRTENATAVALMLGLQYPMKNDALLRAGYSYDIATQIPTPFGGTHEILISYRFKVIIHSDPLVPDKGVRFL